MPYCASRFATVRRPTIEVKVGAVGVGGQNPLRVQSMTTSDTQDVAATVRQSIALAEVGCEIVRITAPNVPAARCLGDIRRQFSAAGFAHVPLVADIHFLPSAAMEAVEHVEKIRINPGNYADKKKFAVRQYSDLDYEEELQRLHDSFAPLLKRCRELGRSLRIGTNHGSLSDRIMNRYGDTPLGMVESALEFLRIARAHSFDQIILSMKASNPKVMIQAYRLLVQRMDQENMHYPLHLGVTEAGDGEDGRIKSAIGIGSLLLDGLGDTLRVSLTEDSVYEIPVARALADRAMRRWSLKPVEPASSPVHEAVDPYRFEKRTVPTVSLAPACTLGPERPPRVVIRTQSVSTFHDTLERLSRARLVDTPVEAVLVPVAAASELRPLWSAAAQLPAGALLVLELSADVCPSELRASLPRSLSLALLRRFTGAQSAELAAWQSLCRELNATLVCAVTAADVPVLAPALRAEPASLVFTAASDSTSSVHGIGQYRLLAAALAEARIHSPLWIRNTAETALVRDSSFLGKLLEASVLSGSLLCDGLGNLLSIETENDPVRATQLCYNVLQGAGARISKTEFVACPSCGRTLFDLQTTTQRIRQKTGHLKGVKLAIMGCIVNGPGEMADADFGYVGGAPGKINLYVGKNCVQYNIPQSEADDRLIALIKEHGKWVDPVANSVPAA